MTDEEHDLARAMVASPGFEWRPGMRDLSSGFGPRRILAVTDDGLVYSAHERIAAPAERTSVRPREAFELPDLADPGTLGVIQHGLLPSLCGEEVELGRPLVVDGPGRYSLGDWDASTVNAAPLGTGKTRGAALARAVIACGART